MKKNRKRRVTRTQKTSKQTQGTRKYRTTKPAERTSAPEPQISPATKPPWGRGGWIKALAVSLFWTVVGGALTLILSFFGNPILAILPGPEFTPEIIPIRYTSGSVAGCMVYKINFSQREPLDRVDLTISIPGEIEYRRFVIAPIVLTGEDNASAGMHSRVEKDKAGHCLVSTEGLADPDIHDNLIGPGSIRIQAAKTPKHFWVVGWLVASGRSTHSATTGVTAYGSYDYTMLGQPITKKIKANILPLHNM